jgi:hypothetical protein
MSQVQVRTEMNNQALENLLVKGDLSQLNTAEKLRYYQNVCESVGLNPLTRPFEFIQLNGKLVLYAKRDATDQLRAARNISISISSKETINDVYIVTAKARNGQGREDESTGAVNVANLKGEALANALMKCETKAKRRVTLSICGLGLLDETEVETIPNARTVEPLPPHTPVTDQLKQLRVEREAVEADPGEHMVTFGKYKGQQLKDLDVYDLAQYVSYIERESAEKNKPIQGQVAEFMNQAIKFIETKEMGPTDDIKF